MKRSGWVVVLAGCLAWGCEHEGTPVGQRCYIGAESEHADEAIIASPALDCPTRTCLHVPESGEPSGQSEHADLCTASCSSDYDCEGVAGTPCESGFVCAIPVVEGPFCCQRQCVCADYLPEDAPDVPAQCEPGVAENTCCNIPGNGDLPHCV